MHSNHVALQSLVLSTLSGMDPDYHKVGSPPMVVCSHSIATRWVGLRWLSSSWSGRLSQFGNEEES